jgi:hypothetical protein
MPGKEAPLRHGWGGDRKARTRALHEKEAERTEMDSHPTKFGDGSSSPQEIDELFEAMMAPRKAPKEL